MAGSAPYPCPAQAGAPDLWSFSASSDDHCMIATTPLVLREIASDNRRPAAAFVALPGRALNGILVPIDFEPLFAPGRADNHGTEAFD